eukprot:TRINITY_DN1981_c0_g1_i1.p1 TRINITY_DN1981_c0_g1~~TRINITY_DN1981_c0_g1_i1.p1  ORF type:complete len:580 (+),score=111.55 TRINITY_DN1981_c0_g1_i1:39-1778(+)
MSSDAEPNQEAVPPERRAYDGERKFRRFAEVMRINPPVVELEKQIVDFEEKFKANWLEDTKKPLTKSLKESFMKWAHTKQAWRRYLPGPMVQAASVAGVAPKMNISTTSAQDDSATEQNSRAASVPTIAVNVVLLAVLVLYLFNAWPLWKSIIDPEASENYKILGVEKDASLRDIKKAFRKLALQHHPDQNNGETTPRYQQVRTAYDELLEQRDEAGEVTGFTDATKEANLRVLMFIGFFLGRIYEFSYHGAEFLLRLIDTQDLELSKYFYLVIHIMCMGLFLWDNGGMGDVLVLIINAWGSISNILKKNPVKLFPDHNHVKWETKYYAVLCILPSLVVSVYRGYPFTSYAFIGKLVMGSIYMASFVMRHRPYIFLNWGLSSRAYSGGNPVFERSNLLNLIPCPLFVRYAVEVMVDDLLAHAMHVPAPFRVCCFAILLISSLQRNFYPATGVLQWGTPDKWTKTEQEFVRMKEKKETTDDAKTRKENAADTRQTNKIIDEAAGKKKSVTAKEKKEARKQVVEEEKESRASVETLVFTLSGAGVFCVVLVLLDAQFSGKGLALSPELHSLIKDFSRTLTV